MIVFLNKQDILERKIVSGRHLENYFPEFANYKNNEQARKEIGSGSILPEVDRARQFIRDEFLKITEKPETMVKQCDHEGRIRQCYIQYSTATDPKNMQFVFKVCSGIIVKNIEDNKLA